MHSLFCISLTMLLAASPEVEVTSLSGTSVSGNLQSLNKTAINLKQGPTSKNFPLAQVLNVRFPKNRFQRSLQTPYSVRLTDGSDFPIQSLQSNDRQMKISGDQIGSLIIPTKNVSSIRFGALNSNIREAWEKLLNSKQSKDLLVVQKENVLDFIDGVVGSITDENIQFLTGEDEVSVNRKRVFGIIYFRQPPSDTPPYCSIRLTNDGLIQASAITYSGTEFEATLQSGTPARFAPGNRLPISISARERCVTSLIWSRAILNILLSSILSGNTAKTNIVTEGHCDWQAKNIHADSTFIQRHSCSIASKMNIAIFAP